MTTGLALPTRPTDIEWGPPLLPDSPHPELEKQLKKLFGGVVPNVFRKIAPAQWLVDVWMSIMRRRHSCVAPAPLIDLVCFISAQENACRYCYGGQRAAIRLVGFPEKRIRALETRVELEQLEPRERAVLAWTSSVVRLSRESLAAQREALAATGLSPVQIAELTFFAALVSAGTRISTLQAVPPDADFEALPDRLFIRIIRPLIALGMKPERREPAPVAAGPFAGVLAPLGDTWGAQLLRVTVDRMLSEGPLPRRTKLLMLLTLAHATSSTAMRADVVRLLGENGITAAEADEIAAHLASSVLDATEHKLVALARDSIRYKAIDIQRRTREVTAGMDTRTILEVIGTIAAGNALVRMSLLS